MALDLGQQVGPLPLGGWVAAVGGGLALAWMVRRGGDDTPAVAPPPPVPTGAVLVPGGSTDVGSSIGPGPIDMLTNDDWRRVATDWLIARGFGAAAVDQALTKYLTGSPLDAQGQSIIEVALQLVGSTPTSVPLAWGDDVPPAHVPGITAPLDARDDQPWGAPIPVLGGGFVDSTPDPIAGGVWLLGADGGVFALGGARFLGSAAGKSYFAGRTAARIDAIGQGYRITATSGETYDYPHGPELT